MRPATGSESPAGRAICPRNGHGDHQLVWCEGQIPITAARLARWLCHYMSNRSCGFPQIALHSDLPN